MERLAPGIRMSAIKVTVSLPLDLLATMDRYVAKHTGASRSSFLADALRSWMQRIQEGEIERYYASVSEEERIENEAWSEATTLSAALLWP
jgi:metal-responsive CopG/Arc/MetJ family transcriptional regulator